MIVDNALAVDAYAIARIHRLARLQAMPWLPELHTPEQDLWYFQIMVLPVGQVLVAREDLHLVGFIAVHHGRLDHLYIAPQHWGSGIGSALLKVARAYLFNLQLWVFQRNARARQFYSHHGCSERELTDV